MKLEKLRLENFRCFGELEIDFHPALTVLVAENGQGKSTILDAVRIALWPFVSGFDLARNAFNDPGNAIAIDDVHLLKLASGDMARQLPARVSMTGDIGDGKRRTWGRHRDKETKATKTKDDGGTKYIRELAFAFQQHVRDPKQDVLSLPVFGYYGTGRLWAQKKLTENARGKDDTKSPDFYIRTFAYLNCLDPASTYKHFKEWFIWAFESYREQQFKQLENRVTSKDVSVAQERIQVVQRAIDDFLESPTGWHTLEYSVSHEKSLVLHHGEYGTLDVEALSDGIRSVLAMVGDIAYRCIKLNPHLGIDAAQETEGVVLIDEVDMHLHPRWQQVVVGQLHAAFPRIQFIVTTHSPQVLTSVDASSVRLLKEERDPETEKRRAMVKNVIQQTKGVASSDILLEIMEVNPTPAVEEATWLADYIAKIENGTHEDDDGLLLRQKLETHFGARHPLMLDADRLIRFQAFKLRRKSAPEE